ncbi:hypothetical protein AVEN_116786-1 [Araneus ventricosus]|uniref:Uncharacterized protein n=1 Tax=Araneus ventricosus TaxID=182803 RepID=A0A4Y2D8B1_ARAVE|nr:hypothetical protein AVEN_116786-1 [Araneus ventricosus]
MISSEAQYISVTLGVTFIRPIRMAGLAEVDQSHGHHDPSTTPPWISFPVRLYEVHDIGYTRIIEHRPRWPGSQIVSVTQLPYLNGFKNPLADIAKPALWRMEGFLKIFYVAAINFAFMYIINFLFC